MRLLPQRNPVAEELCSLELLVLLVCCFFFFPKRDLFHGNDSHAGLILSAVAGVKWTVTCGCIK